MTAKLVGKVTRVVISVLNFGMTHTPWYVSVSLVHSSGESESIFIVFWDVFE